MFNIVLVEPEIPQNTGNIARTCAATGARLHLIHPLGFSVEDRHLRRAGLDYWNLLEVQHYQSLEEFWSRQPQASCYYASAKMGRLYNEYSYAAGGFFFFGKETAGLPEPLLKANIELCVRIPKKEQARSLNLSNSVAVLLYEALRQHGFPGLVK